MAAWRTASPRVAAYRAIKVGPRLLPQGSLDLSSPHGSTKTISGPHGCHHRHAGAARQHATRGRHGGTQTLSVLQANRRPDGSPASRCATTAAEASSASPIRPDPGHRVLNDPLLPGLITACSRRFMLWPRYCRTGLLPAWRLPLLSHPTLVADAPHSSRLFPARPSTGIYDSANGAFGCPGLGRTLSAPVSPGHRAQQPSAGPSVSATAEHPACSVAAIYRSADSAEAEIVSIPPFLSKQTSIG